MFTKSDEKNAKGIKMSSYYIVVGSQHQELGSLEHMLQILRFLEQHLREHTRKGFRLLLPVLVIILMFSVMI